MHAATEQSFDPMLLSKVHDAGTQSEHCIALAL